LPLNLHDVLAVV